MQDENLNHNFQDEDKKEEQEEKESIESDQVRDDVIKRDEEPMESKEPVVEETKNRVKKILYKIFGRK